MRWLAELITLLTIVSGFVIVALFGFGVLDVNNPNHVVNTMISLATAFITSELLQRLIFLRQIADDTGQVRRQLSNETTTIESFEFSSAEDMFVFLANEMKPRMRVMHAAITATITKGEREYGGNVWEDAITKAVKSKKTYTYIANCVDLGRRERMERLAQEETFHPYSYEHEGVDQPIYNFIIVDDSVLLLNLPRYNLVDSYVWLRSRNAQLIQRFSKYFGSLQNISKPFAPN